MKLTSISRIHCDEQTDRGNQIYHVAHEVETNLLRL